MAFFVGQKHQRVFLSEEPVNIKFHTDFSRAALQTDKDALWSL